jgi:hypothetical protein
VRKKMYLKEQTAARKGTHQRAEKKQITIYLKPEYAY